MLEPISNGNSISRVTASIYTPQSILNPVKYFERLKEDPRFHKYQKKGVIHQKNIGIINEKEFDISENKNVGFIFEEFEDGNSINVLKLENNDRNDKAILSIENKKYNSWTEYKARFLEDFKCISETVDLYVEALVLNYIDEFIWNSNSEKIDINGIFNVNSDLLNQKFIKSYNASLRSVSQSSRIDEKDFQEENTEIFFNNDIKRIIINHSYAIKLSKYDLYENINLSDYFDSAHDSNKSVLLNLLSEGTQKLIGLT